MPRFSSKGTAEQASHDDSRFTVNVAELRKVIPRDLTLGGIDARLGASWIADHYVEQFLRETAAQWLAV